MKTFLIFSSLAFLLGSCNKQETATPTPSSEVSAAKPYPLDVCLVSGEKLGSMGEPVVIVHDGQQIKFCCESCQPKFEKDPAKYLAKLQPQP